MNFGVRSMTALAFLVRANVLMAMLVILLSSILPIPIFFASPVCALIGYGIYPHCGFCLVESFIHLFLLTSGKTFAWRELRTDVFSKLAQRTICHVSEMVFYQLHDLDLNHHLRSNVIVSTRGGWEKQMR